MKRIVLIVLFFLPFLASAQSLNISWVDAIGGSGNEIVQSTVVDASGNVYIAGSFEGVVNFNPNGTTTNLTSVGLKDAFFAMYTTAGVLVWVKQLGAAAVDEVYALAVDGTNVYVAGYYNGTVNFNPGGTAANLTASGSNDIFYGKYLSSNGALVWTNAHGNTGNDAAIAIKVDASSNVYVTGYFSGTVDFDPSNVVTNNKLSVGAEDIFLIKLTSAGALGWIDTFGSTGSDAGLSVDIDNSFAYISGYFSNTVDADPGIGTSNSTSLGGTDAFFARYAIGNGAIGWWINSGSGTDDEATSIVVSGTNFYLGGVFSGSSSFYSLSGNVSKISNGGSDIFVAKYNGSTSFPTLTWLNTIGGISDDRSNLLTLDASANVYSTGSFDGTVDFDPSPSSNTDLGSIGLTDIYVASYSSGTGAIRFAKAAGSTSDEEGTTVAVDGSGNVYVGGYFQGITSFDFNSSSQDKSSLGSWDAFVAKYAQSAFAPEPATQPPSLQVVDLQSTQFTYDVTAATGFNGGYLHIYKVGSAPTALPVDGIEYFAGDILSDGSIVKYSDNITAGNFYGSLTPGTAYFIKIFSFNGSGTLTNYLTTNPLSTTITTPGGTTPTITSFTPLSGSIGTSVTITGTNFSTTATNNNVKFNSTTATIAGTPTTTSITVTVPTGATTGKITVEVAGQIGTSVTDFTVNTVTLASEPTNSPTSLVFSGITSTSYSFNFTAAIAGTTAPDGYIGIRKIGSAPTSAPVDGITYASTDAFGGGFINFIGTGTAYDQTSGTVPATTYFLAIYSYKGSGSSINYKQVSPLAGSVTTLAASSAPTVASFLPVSGTVGTSVTLTGSGFSTTAANNIVKFNGTIATIAGATTATSITVTVPTGATTGKITVEVAGQTGTSLLDFTVNVDTTPPTITGNTTVKTSKGGDPIKVSITAADAESGIASAVIYYGESTSFDWTKLDEPMTKVGANWEYTIPGNVVRELGVEYKVIVYNGVGDDADTGVLGVTITTDANGPSVPFTGAGTSQSNYKIISIPLALESKTVNKIFGDDLGDYGDKSKWRMFRYSGGRTIELNGSGSINPGEAYWFISSTNATIDTGSGTTVGRISDPFTIQVTQGFNQIGNPYAINLLWSDVQTYSFDANDNSNLGLGKLRVFNGTGFDDGLVLKRFEGGFVMAAKSGTLVFPAEKNSAAGRTEVKPITTVANSIDGPDWEVNFELTNGIQAMNFGGIGMNKKASDEYDAYDDFTLPRFLDYIELNHAVKDLYNLSYTKDIVPTSENHTWEFSVESNSNEVVTMKWDNSFFGNNSKQLVLWDVNLQKGLDMRTENQYLFSKSRSGSLKVFYGDEKYVKEKTAVSQLVFHDLFPNPARDNVTISFSLPSEDRVTIEVIDLLGKKIATVADGNFKEGYHEVTWNTLDTSGSAITNGIYITQIKGLKSDHQKRLSINK